MRHLTKLLIALSLLLPSCLSWGSAEIPGPRKALLDADFEVLDGNEEWNGWPVRIRHTRTGIVLRLVKPGSFWMGASAGDNLAKDEEKPSHQVNLDRAFYMGETEVSVSHWRNYIDEGGAPERGITRPTWSSRTGWGDGYPVTNISQRDATVFCRFFGFRLPTEAEWEYVCRAGTVSTWSFGMLAKDLGRYAWFGNDKDGAHPIGKLWANPWGFYDMYGNLWEWTSSGYDPNGYSDDLKPDTNPPGSSPDAFALVIRGGSWSSPVADARSSARKGLMPDRRADVLGFRVVYDIPPVTDPSQ